MFNDSEGPIDSFDWGSFVIKGEMHSADGEGVGKDICIIDGIVTPWSARKGHLLKPKMVSGIIGSGIEILVIGNGVNGALKVPEKTRKAISDAGVSELIIERTPQACATFNRLYREGESVALLAHGTC
ncbi:MAG: Mth938-like domain-containing protein [Brevefilum sp.]|nr:Mth938-like domain-containing protein [Brevefilum sp.]MDT8382401.1 Mth938-like domain-containing protein [Brevefilum sp.]MDW7754031.1 Mth938-like domain-containing protein [Brevefilum sp.]